MGSTTDIRISSRGDNLGGSSRVYIGNSGRVLQFRTLTGMGGIVITENGNLLEVDGSGIPQGDITNADNVGAGLGESFFQKNGSVLEFRRINGINGIGVANNGDSIEVDGANKANYLDNIIYLPGPGPDNLVFGNNGTTNTYICTNGFVQTVNLPEVTALNDGKRIIVKSLGGIGPVITANPFGAQLIDSQFFNKIITDNAGVEFLSTWNGGVNPTFATFNTVS